MAMRVYEARDYGSVKDLRFVLRVFALSNGDYFSIVIDLYVPEWNRGGALECVQVLCYYLFHL